MMIEVLYSCHSCGIKERKVKIRLRYLNEDVLVWMKHVIECVSIDHRSVAPICFAKTLDNLYIPLPPQDSDLGIGQGVADENKEPEAQ